MKKIIIVAAGISLLMMSACASTNETKRIKPNNNDPLYKTQQSTEYPMKPGGKVRTP